MWNAETLEWIDLEITSYCNINCPSCLRTTEKETLGHIINDKILPLELIKEKITREKFPNLKILNLCGTMDEPITHPQIMEIADYAEEIDCHLHIATNGSLKTTSWWSRFADRLPKSHMVVFAIDGIKEVNEIYRVGSNYDKILNNARELIKKGKKVEWQFILFEHNKHQLEEAEKIAKEEGFYRFRTIKSFRDYNNETLKRGIKIVENPVEENDTIECAFGKDKRIYITHLGDVIPCCHLASNTLRYIYAGKKTNSVYHNILSKHGGELVTNLKYNDIEDVIEDDFFKDIIASWDSKTPVDRCFTVCKKNRRNQGEYKRFK